MARIKDKNVAEGAAINATKIAGAMGTVLRKSKNFFFVDGSSGLDTSTGKSRDSAKATIQGAVDAASAWDIIYVFPKDIPITSTDPGSYAETVIIPNTKPGISIIGVGTGRAQGGLPQIKIGAGAVAMITIRAPGCVIANIGINGVSSTGGGILLDDNSTSKVAFGTTIVNCHFKNCKAHATDGAAGGAIYTAASGSAWQVLIQSCRFYNCKGGIVMTNTSFSVPNDWVIEDCVFGTSANTSTDVDICAVADGIIGLTIRNCSFDTVDVPAGTSGTVQRYIKLGAGTKGGISGCTFACISEGASEKTFGAAGTACIVPTTVRISKCFGESATQDTSGEVYRT